MLESCPRQDPGESRSIEFVAAYGAWKCLRDQQHA